MFLGIIIFLGVFVFYFITTYNKIVRQEEMVKNAMGQIAVQVESRWDALKSLISATKQYSEHEAKTLQSITESRSNVNNNSTVNDIEKDGKEFEQALNTINVVAEQYPDLKASNIYLNTMDSINNYEDNVRHSRMIFNDTVTKFNRMILTFPANLVAKMQNFTEKEYFQNTETKKDMPSWD